MHFRSFNQLKYKRKKLYKDKHFGGFWQIGMRDWIGKGK
jgi:hypothetical protein